MALLRLSVIVSLLFCMSHQDTSVNRLEHDMMLQKDAQSFLHSRQKRGFIDDIFNGGEHRRRSRERIEDANEKLKMQKEIACRMKCWKTWSAWGECSGRCNTGRMSRSRVRSNVAECRPFPCPGPQVEYRNCHINCGDGGIPKNNSCVCHTGYKGGCCKTRVTCPRPSKPEHGDMEGLRTATGFYGTVVNYSCKEGYVLVGPELRKCDVNGKFTGTNPVCRKIECPIPAIPAHGTLVNQKPKYYFRSTVGYKCDVGYELKGVKSRECVLGDNHTGKWTAFDPHCQIKSCGNPGTPRHGVKTGTVHTYDSEVSFTCQRGYTLIGSESRKCLETAHWSGVQPVCKEVLCEMLERPQHGMISARESSVDSVLDFSCEIGYDLVGSEKLMCLHNGSWNGTAPVCEAIDCGDPGTPVHGSRIDSGFGLNQQVEFACQDGYILQGHSSTACKKDTTWTNPVPTCSACATNTYKEGPSDGGRCVPCPPNSHTVTPASINIKQCICNYGFSGQPGMTCKRIECKPLPTPEHGIKQPCGNYMGDTCAFDCKNGYILGSGSSNRRCGPNGMWDGSDLKCEACPLNTFKAEVGSCLPCPQYSHTVSPASSRQDCVCDQGFTVQTDGSCADVDECTSNGGLGECEEACENIMGGFRCFCTTPGYKLNPDDKRSCLPERLCNNLTETDAPANGGLACHWFNEQNSQQCSVKCNPGYDFPTRTNNYETCGPVTNYTWTFKFADSTAQILPCIEEFFPGYRIEVDSAYFTSACRELSEEEKDEVKKQFAAVLNKDKVCVSKKRQICDFKNIGIICGRSRRKRGTSEEEVDVVKISVDVEARQVVRKPINCDRICQALRIPADNCMTACPKIYKRYMRARVLYINKTLNANVAQQHEILNFVAVGRTFEAVSDGYNVSDIKVDCEPGMMKEKEKCVPCLKGSMFFEKYNECVQCPNGTYQDEVMQNECKQCPPGTTSHTGATSCFSCPQGTYGDFCAELCDCEHGTCDQATGHCICPSGWQGDRCDQDIPGCKGDSCFPGVTCTDVKAPGTGHLCGACPVGFNGNGISCLAVMGA